MQHILISLHVFNIYRKETWQGMWHVFVCVCEQLSLFYFILMQNSTAGLSKLTGLEKLNHSCFDCKHVALKQLKIFSAVHRLLKPHCNI